MREAERSFVSQRGLASLEFHPWKFTRWPPVSLQPFEQLVGSVPWAETKTRPSSLEMRLSHACRPVCVLVTIGGNGTFLAL